MPLMLTNLHPDGLLWFAFQKGRFGAANGLTRDHGWDLLCGAG